MVVLDPRSILDEGEDAEVGEEVRVAIMEIPRETLWAFMTAVVSAHVGVFLVSLGGLLIWFRGQHAVGLTLVTGGVLALVLTGVVYHRHRTAA